MVEKELGKRNVGFASMKYMNMEEKAIVARDYLDIFQIQFNCLPLEPRFPLSAAEGPPPQRCPLQKVVVPKRCPLPWRWSLGSEAPAGDNQG